jgi:hypothetical protein
VELLKMIVAPFDPQELEHVGVPKLCGRGFGQSPVPELVKSAPSEMVNPR